VGAALLAKNGEIISGANVESASYGLTCCAERVALFKRADGRREKICRAAVVARAPGGPMPCGRVPAVAGGIRAGRPGAGRGTAAR